MSKALDWPGLMRAGMLGLKLTPDRFWSLTPVELLLMLGISGVTPPMARSRLDELARAYPDARPTDARPTDARPTDARPIKEPDDARY